MESRTDLKLKILDCALTHVPFEGWSQATLDRAAQEVTGDPSYGWRLFPQGPREAITFWSTHSDQAMLASLPAPDTLRVRERITLAVRTRISLLAPYREAARTTARYLKSPPQLGSATRLLYKTVNEIWYYAGDTSTDYNFYTKRALLAWVYSSTFLYWLKDTSDDYEKTWAFLDHRIAEVLALPQYFTFPWKWGKKG